MLSPSTLSQSLFLLFWVVAAATKRQFVSEFDELEVKAECKVAGRTAEAPDLEKLSCIAAVDL